MKEYPHKVDSNHIVGEDDTRPSIYESPDKGDTIYKRKLGDYDNRTLVRDESGSYEHLQSLRRGRSKF